MDKNKRIRRPTPKIVFIAFLMTAPCFIFIMSLFEKDGYFLLPLDYIRYRQIMPSANKSDEAMQQYYVISSNFSLIGSDWIKNALPKYSNPKKYFIYFCSCHQACGGLGDREKGIVSAYMISLLTNRTFGMDHKCPVDFSKYLKPNKVNWIIDTKRIKSLSSRSHNVYMNRNFLQSLKTLNFEQFYKEDVFYWSENYDCIEYLRNHKAVPHLAPWLLHTSTGDVYKIILNILFKASENFTNFISPFIGKVAGKNLICAHLRQGRNPTLPHDGVGDRFLKEEDLNNAWSLLNSSIDEESKLFISSDSENIKQEAASRFPSYFVDLPGPIVHIDLATSWMNNPDKGLMKVIFDQLILAHCSTLIISKSGFSYIGAFLRKDSYNLYCIADDNITSCGREKFFY